MGRFHRQWGLAALLACLAAAPAVAQQFDTGLSRAQIDAGWWMFTTCPAGYTSSIPFTPVNRDSLVASTYQCVAAGR
ncbi:MAG TPA: hypothetical protein VNV38_05765 [Stellaceae bacterium]|jgi:hypothetical protein|nr:hypothetical protein [Stellaceae bacterium]